VVPSQVAVPPGGAEQAVHDVPQLAVLVFDTQAPLQLWKPELHVNPHDVPLHVAVALVTEGQALQDVVPQLAVLVFAEQALPQA